MELKAVLVKMRETKKLRELLATMVTDSKMHWFIDHTVIYLTDEIDKYLDANGIINDEEDLGYYSAVQYVELKARWIQMNLRLNYQAFVTGEGEPEILMRAAATSHLLSVIEPHVNQGYVQEIQRILAQPVLGDLVKQAA